MRTSGSRAGLAIGAVLCAAAWLAIRWYIPEEGPSALDREAASAVASLRSDAMTDFWHAAAWLGEAKAIIGLTVILTILATVGTGWRRALWIPAAVAVAYALNTLLKGIVDRARPDGMWGIAADGASFPSGNAMLAIVLYGLTAAWLIRYGGYGRFTNKAAGTIALLLILLAGFGRLYFSVHYVTDIAAGYAAGGFLLLLLLLIAPARSGR